MTTTQTPAGAGPAREDRSDGDGSSELDVPVAAFPPVGEQPAWRPSAPPEPSVFRQHALAILVAAVVVLIAVISIGVWAAERADAARVGAPVPAASEFPDVASSGGGAGLAAEEQRFVGILDRLGVPYASAPAMAQTGRDVCSHLERGSRPPAEAAAIANGGSFTPEQATEIVRASAVAYCPKYRPAVGLPS